MKKNLESFKHVDDSEDYRFCPICGGANKINTESVIDYVPIEVVTICKYCGHNDNWCQGVYQSTADKKQQIKFKENK